MESFKKVLFLNPFLKKYHINQIQFLLKKYSLTQLLDKNIIIDETHFYLKYPNFNLAYYVILHEDLYKNFFNQTLLYLKHYHNYGIKERIFNYERLIKLKNLDNFDFLKTNKNWIQTNIVNLKKNIVLEHDDMSTILKYKLFLTVSSHVSKYPI